MVHKTGSGNAAQIKNDLEQVLAIVGPLHRVADVKRQGRREAHRGRQLFLVGS